MPYALVLLLQTSEGGSIPAISGDLLHAAFFDLVSRTDAALANSLHQEEARKPFTLGLIPLSTQADGFSRIGLRVTLLKEDLFPAFVRGLLDRGHRSQLRFGRAHYTVNDMLTTAALHPLAGCARYAEIWEEAEPKPSLTLRFDSPTVFRSFNRDVLLPDPRLIWQSWANTWNAFADEEKPCFEEKALLEQIAAHVTIEHFRLESRSMLLKGIQQKGFVGACSFKLQGLTESDLRACHALARFAFYAGTGRKTSMGMGQTRLQIPVGLQTVRSS